MRGLEELDFCAFLLVHRAKLTMFMIQMGKWVSVQAATCVYITDALEKPIGSKPKTPFILLRQATSSSGRLDQFLDQDESLDKGRQGGGDGLQGDLQY